jgi:Zn ribbon nucleic-acid-binding protein
MRFSSTAAHIDREMVKSIIERNRLAQLGMSEAIYGGDCPFCGRARTFTLWAEKGVYRCFWCGCDGRFVPAPERAAEDKAKRKARLAEMAV